MDRLTDWSAPLRRRSAPERPNARAPETASPFEMNWRRVARLFKVMILRCPQKPVWNRHTTNIHARPPRFAFFVFEFSGTAGRCIAALVLGGAILLSRPAV